MIFVGECGGELIRLDEALEVEINQEINVPADDLKVVFPYMSDFPALERIYLLDECDDIFKAVSEGNVFFGGIVDEQILSADYSGARIKIFARSAAALLLDNECPPMMYVNPSADVIADKHLIPFGVRFSDDDKTCRSGVLSIAKGSSHYKALDKFCAEFMGSVPRIDGKGVCRLDVYENVGEIDFDNRFGVSFESAEVCENRYCRISRVYVSGENGNDFIVNDDESQGLGIVRERYLNLSESKTHTLSDAENIIKNGKMKSLMVTLVCDGCFADKIGYGARVRIEGCEGKEFVISQVRYRLKDGVEKSRVRCTLSP